jgi:hypothetical protein
LRCLAVLKGNCRACCFSLVIVMVVVAVLVVVADGGTPGGRFLKTAYCFLTGGGGRPNVG